VINYSCILKSELSWPVPVQHCRMTFTIVIYP